MLLTTCTKPNMQHCERPCPCTCFPISNNVQTVFDLKTLLKCRLLHLETLRGHFWTINFPISQPLLAAFKAYQFVWVANKLQLATWWPISCYWPPIQVANKAHHCKMVLENICSIKDESFRFRIRIMLPI